MKSLPALCIRQSRLCIALGLLVASSTLVTVASEAAETTQDASKRQFSVTRKRISRPAIRSAKPRHSDRSRSKIMLAGFSDFVENKYKQATKRPRFHSTAQNRKSHTAAQQTVGGKDAVQRELKALYAKDGRQMPSMQMKDAPNTQSSNSSRVSAQRRQRAVTTAPVTPKPTVHRQPTKQAEPRRLQTQAQAHRHQHSSRYQQQHRSRRKPNFFQRLFGQKQKSHRQSYRYKPLPQQRVVQHPAVQFPTRKQAQVPPVPPRVIKTQVAQQAPVVKAPVAKGFPVPPAPEQIIVKKTVEQKAKLVNSETPVVQPKRTASSLENPFPELSENEADGVRETKEKTSPKPTPFTGLTLNEKPSEEIISGLKGFCILTLRDKRQLLDAKEEFRSTYQGKAYIFSSKAAQDRFEKNPVLYAPVKGGQDTISLASAEEAESGSLDFAVWYKSRLYLFSNQNNLQIFVQNPSKYRQADVEK